MTTTPDPQLPYAELSTIGDGYSELLDRAADAMIAATEPTPLGDHSFVIVRPNDWVAEIIDERPHEDHPRFRTGQFVFTNVESLTRYVNRFKSPDTLGYITDIAAGRQNVTGRQLTSDLLAARFVLDDYADLNVHPDRWIGNRVHQAALQLTPTVPARRWGHAFDRQLDQQDFVDLIDDGISEIAAPAAGELRDLISDLHAIRTVSAKNLLRTGGGTQVEIAEKVTLHAGPGHIVQVPPTLTLIFAPWTALDTKIKVLVKIRPTVTADRVTFTLTCPDLETELADLLGLVAITIAEHTGIEPLRTVLK